MRRVEDLNQMYDLCWAVLYRYAVVRGCFPSPPIPIRISALSSIKRAWKRAGVADSLRHAPAEFLTVGPLPDLSTEIMLTQEPVRFQVKNKIITAKLGRPAHELLEPEPGMTCPWMEE